MPYPSDIIGQYALALKQAQSSSMMQLARMLHDLHVNTRDLFPTLAGTAGIKPRRAYALASVGKVFGATGFPDQQLNRIGWAKLALIAPKLTTENAVELVTRAQRMKLHELSRWLNGEEVPSDARALLLRLSPTQDLRFRQILQEYGAAGPVSGLTGKEEALIRFMDTLEVPPDRKCP